jgi:Ca-activated chloride channel homolog
VCAQDSPVAISPRLSRAAANRIAPDIRVDSDLVLVPVLVTDRHEKPITGLNKTDFQVFDDKVEQQITQFSFEDAPVSVVLVFDASSSMADKMGASRRAAAEFLRTANPQDEFALVVFNDSARIVSGFADTFEALQNRLAFTEARGRTALLDGVYLAMNEMRSAKYARKAIVLISDGMDNNSRYTESEVKDRAREAGVQIFAIGIVDPRLQYTTPEAMGGSALLDDVSGVTGGRMYQIDDPGQLPAAASQIGGLLRSEYVLGYSPSMPRNGRTHRIKVRLAPPPGSSRLRATFRTSYLSPEP